MENFKDIEESLNRISLIVKEMIVKEKEQKEKFEKNNNEFEIIILNNDTENTKG